MHEAKKPGVTSASGEKSKELAPCYPETRRAYEKLMQHDAYKRVKGRIRQTTWEDRS